MQVTIQMQLGPKSPSLGQVHRPLLPSRRQKQQSKPQALQTGAKCLKAANVREAMDGDA